MNAFEQGMTSLLVAQLSELYFCESKLVHALRKMAEAATAPALRAAFESHRQETIDHVHRLEQMFSTLHVEPRAFPCKAVEGLLEDGTWMMHRLKDDPVLDTALIAAAQKTEMLEIASYRSAIALARQLGHEKVAQLCESTLQEEEEADNKLTGLGETLTSMQGTVGR